MGELAHCERHGPKHSTHIVQSLCDEMPIQRGCMNGFCSWKVALDRNLVLRVSLATVIGKQRDFVVPRKVPKDIVRTDLASGIDRQQLARFDPENTHLFTSKSLRSWPPRGGGPFPGSPDQAQRD